MKLSVIILTKNAGDVLEKCLESVHFADEIIVVDNGSTDKTIAIAKEKSAVVVNGIDNNFAENRNIGLKRAKGEWVLYIDADERVSDILRQNVQNAMGSGRFSAYKVQRKNFYLGNHQWPKIELLERFFKKNSLKGWYGKLHETPQYDGSISTVNGYLLHYTHRDLSSMLKKTLVWSQIEAKLRLDVHHPKIVAWRLIRVMLTGFWDSYVKQNGWKAGTMGLIESFYQAYSMFVTYATLWEMQHEK